MPRSPNDKLKLLYLKQILEEKTDEDNILTAQEIITELAKHGISIERKTVYADIDILRRFGMDIELKRGKTPGYYLSSRAFELPELKLLVDAAQSAYFITDKKSNELIHKLSALTSEAQAKQLERQVYMTGRPKAFNEAVYYNVDTIHAAIHADKKIQFRYFDYNTKKRRVYRKSGGQYQCTPMALFWNDNQYYLVAYSAEHDGLRHYRVDRMNNVIMLEDAADQYDRKNFNAAEYSKKMFGMYGGETVNATLSFDNSLVSVVFDHFGSDVHISDTGDGRFTVTVDVSASPVFFGWMFQFGSRARIESPDTLITSMRELISENSDQYGI